MLMVQERLKTPLSVQNRHFGSWTSYRTENHLGSTAAVINDKGELIESTMYTAYGEQVPLMVLPGTEEEAREKFTGKEFDTEGGSGNGVDGINLDYFGRRFFDPEIGIWTSTDPKQWDWNSYAYCSGDPINYVDPYGENPFIGMAIGAAIGFTAGGFIGGQMDNDPNSSWSWGGALAGTVVGGALGYGIASELGAANAWQGGKGFTGNINTPAQDAAQAALGSATQSVSSPVVMNNGAIDYWSAISKATWTPASYLARSVPNVVSPIAPVANMVVNSGVAAIVSTQSSRSASSLVNALYLTSDLADRYSQWTGIAGVGALVITGGASTPFSAGMLGVSFGSWTLSTSTGISADLLTRNRANLRNRLIAAAPQLFMHLTATGTIGEEIFQGVAGETFDSYVKNPMRKAR